MNETGLLLFGIAGWFLAGYFCWRSRQWKRLALRSELEVLADAGKFPADAVDDDPEPDGL